MEIEHFKKNKKYRNILLTLGVIAVLGGGLLIYRSFAYYQEEKTYDVLRGVVPEFSKEDIELAFTINGEKQAGEFPSHESVYSVKSVTCENGVTAEWDKEDWGLVKIKANGNYKIKCTVDF